jgi:ketosteroid isomerase-like protein
VSLQDVEIVRRMYELFNRGDVAAAREALHPDVELHQPPDVPDTGSYYGRDDFERGFVLWLSAWEDPRFEPLDIEDAGDCVIMRVHVTGTGRTSGVRSSMEYFHAWTTRDGQAHRCFVRSTREEALAAARLGE